MFSKDYREKLETEIGKHVERRERRKNKVLAVQSRAERPVLYFNYSDFEYLKKHTKFSRIYKLASRI